MMSNNLNESQITEEMFRNAKQGDAFKDCHGRICEIIRNNTKGNVGFPVLIINIPGYGTEEVTLHPDLGIIDEEWATMIELNHESATFVPKEPTQV